MSNKKEPTLKDWQTTSKAIMAAAIKVKKINPDFFWAASEIAGPSVDLQTGYKVDQKVPFRNLLETTRPAHFLAEAMARAVQVGGCDVPAKVKDDADRLLGHYRAHVYHVPEYQAA